VVDDHRVRRLLRYPHDRVHHLVGVRLTCGVESTSGGTASWATGSAVEDRVHCSLMVGGAVGIRDGAAAKAAGR
jgi:hypothetical protein